MFTAHSIILQWHRCRPCSRRHATYRRATDACMRRTSCKTMSFAESFQVGPPPAVITYGCSAACPCCIVAPVQRSISKLLSKRHAQCVTRDGPTSACQGLHSQRAVAVTYGGQVRGSKVSNEQGTMDNQQRLCSGIPRTSELWSYQ